MDNTNPLSTSFTNVVLYVAGGMFGVNNIACKNLTVTTGVKYAQYDNAVQVDYLEKGKRTAKRRILSYQPWLRVVDAKVAIEPDSALVKQPGGGSISRYASCDPRWVTDFEDQLQAAGTPVLLAIGVGERRATTDESDT